MWVRFDQMVWPSPGEHLDALGWRLRYEDTLTKSDLVAAASVISAYRALLSKTQKQRNYICQQIKLRTEKEPEG